jgi:hypothetical protein
MAMGLFAQNREIFAKGLPIHSAGGSFVHTIICPTGRNTLLVFENVNLQSKADNAAVTCNRSTALKLL